MMAAVAIVAALACNDTVAPTPATPAGAYPLRGINGNPPPQIVFAGAQGTTSIVGGLVTLRTNGTFRDSTDLETVTATGVERSIDVGNGTWRLSNDTVFFRVQQSEYFMLRNGVELIQDFEGIELIYRR